MMKSKKDLILDQLYYLKRNITGPVYRKSKGEYEIIPVRKARKKINYIFDSFLALHRFEKQGGENVWIRKKSETIYERLSFSTIERFLPNALGISPYVGVCLPALLKQVAKDKDVDSNRPVFSLRLCDLFPRDESDIEYFYDLRSFDSDKAFELAVNRNVDFILNKSKAFFQEFNSYDDLIVLYKENIFPWGRKPVPYLLNKKEILKLLESNKESIKT